MNFGQALAALLTGGRPTCAELGRPGAFLAMQNPVGMVTERFIVLQLANGECMPWNPSQAAIFATNWSLITSGQNEAKIQHEHELEGAHSQSTR